MGFNNLFPQSKKALNHANVNNMIDNLIKENIDINCTYSLVYNDAKTKWPYHNISFQLLFKTVWRPYEEVFSITHSYTPIRVSIPSHV